VTGATEERITALAVRQHGVVTRAQLLNTGLTARMIEGRLAKGRLRPLQRGVYLVGPVEPTWVRERAAVLASGREAALGHRSGLSLWVLLPPAGCDDPVDVMIPAGSGGRKRPGIRYHRVARLGARERGVVDGIAVTTPIRTLLDVASRVGRADGLTARELEQAVARAERNGLVTRSELWSRTAARPGKAARPGTAVLRSLLEAEGGPALTRSAAEDLLLAMVRSAGLPAPETNARVGSYEVDFLWRRAGIAVEVDGYEFHGSRRRFEADRRRDGDLLGAGITVLRLTWRQLAHERDRTLVRLIRALDRAERDRTGHRSRP
jgi:very-short-patch-repair endonuclease